jgi:hypothetical protein
LSGINHLLAQSLNQLPSVVAGLVFWIVAYWQLSSIKSGTFGDVATLVLWVLPVEISVVSFNVAVARWNGKTEPEALVFLVLGLISLGFSAWSYLRDTNVRKALEAYDVFSGTKSKKWGFIRQKQSIRLILRLLVGAISVLASVTLLVSGGWELIEGSAIIGLILALFGLAIFGLNRWPDSWPKLPWNFFKGSYSVLTKSGTQAKSTTPAL